MTEPNDNRTHEPNLRELTAELDGRREGIGARLENVDTKFETVETKFQANDKLDLERDKRYEQGRNSDAQAVSAAFAASEKAILKAEQTGKENDAKNNEFRGQLTDQAATFMTRVEAEAQFRLLGQRLDELKTAVIAGDRENRDSIQNLRESRSEGTGAAQQGQQYREEKVQDRAQRHLGVGVLIGLPSLILVLVELFRVIDGR